MRLEDRLARGPGDPVTARRRPRSGGAWVLPTLRPRGDRVSASTRRVYVPRCRREPSRHRRLCVPRSPAASARARRASVGSPSTRQDSGASPSRFHCPSTEGAYATSSEPDMVAMLVVTPETSRGQRDGPGRRRLDGSPRRRSPWPLRAREARRRGPCHTARSTTNQRRARAGHGGWSDLLNAHPAGTTTITQQDWTAF